MMPAMLPVLAMNSAKMFNFNRSRVFSESEIRAKGVELSMHVLGHQKPDARTRIIILPSKLLVPIETMT